MFTVMRFLDKSGAINLEALGATLDRTCPGLFDGLDRVPRRFSCSLCSENGWRAHRQAILATVTKCDETIKQAQKLGVSVSLDIAIEPEDYHGLVMLELPFDQEILGFLHTRVIDVTITIYGSA
jgi:hypothetical protein